MPSPHAPTKYMGPQVFYPATVSRNRRPTSTDVFQPETGKYYIITSSWQVGKNPTTGVEGEIWVLTKIVANTSYWELITGGASGGTVVGLRDNSGAIAGPDVSGIIDVVTANSTPVFAASGTTLTLDFDLTNLVLGSDLPSLNVATGNVGIGQNVLNALTNGEGNVFAGHLAGQLLNTGSNNVGIGKNSLTNMTGSVQNTAVGHSALAAMTTSVGSNTAIGYASLLSVLTGTANIGLGANSGQNFAGAESSNILIGNAGVLGNNNTIRIGTQGSGVGEQNRAFIAGVAGVNVSNQLMVVIDSSSGQLGTQIIAEELASFNAYLGTSVSNVTGDGTVYPIICDTEVFDLGADYDVTTGVFTAPVDGIYSFSANISLNNIGAAHTTCRMSIHIDNAANVNQYVYTINECNPATTASLATLISFSGGAVVQMLAGWKMFIQTIVAGSTLTVGVNGGGATSSPKCFISGVCVSTT